jgi:acyl-CoA thioester hydrolase
VEHVATARVLFADTDAMGIAYYGSYLRWFETGRVELLRRRGLAYGELAARGISLPVREARARYLSPARYDDEIRILAEVSVAGRASVTFSYRIEGGDGKALAEGSTVHAFVGGGKVVPAPRDFLEMAKPVEKPEGLKEKGG